MNRRYRSPANVRGRARGFALVAAIFLLVIIGTMGAFAVHVSANAHATSAAAVLGARAYEAARAGIEWAAFQVRDPNSTLAPGAIHLPDCFASPTALSLPPAMGGYTVEVACTRFPAMSASPNFHEEGDKRSAYYLVTATASMGVAGRPDYVERRLEARIEKCKDPTAPGPAYAC